MPLAERVVTQLEAPFRIGLQEAISASVGIALTDARDSSGEEVLGRADLAMYAAKARGRSQCAVFDDDMRSRAEGRLSMQGALRPALQTGELVVHYQPIVRLADTRPVGLEALLRWDRPGHGLLLPGEFLPLAESSRLISALDSWVLGEAVGTLARSCAPDLYVAVNLSARDLAQPDFLEAVASALHRSALQPQRLVLEITESVMLEEGLTAATHLQSLRELGVQVAIDDFGTGYSSLAYLRRLPADTLKIDRSFVVDVDVDPASAVITGAIVTMAHTLGLHVVAKGVERASQAHRLRQLGCDAAQGYWYSRPVPVAQLPTIDGRARTGDHAAATAVSALS